MTRRFVVADPCPVCGGFDQAPRGRGERCFGFLSDDGKYAHCTRQERARGLPMETSDTYAHRLDGECRCGEMHGAAAGARPVQGPTRSSRIVATFDYTDRTGARLYQAVKYDPKSFKVRRSDGNGGWIWDLKGVTRVLYNLPFVASVATAGGRVYDVEGEKDADRVVGLGLCATTNIFGAGKWRDEYAEALRGAEVVVIADKDPSESAKKPKGRAHARTVARSCHGKARSVKVIELPGEHVKDASDWISAGGTREQLEALADAAPAWEAHPAASLATQLDDEHVQEKRDPEPYDEADVILGEPDIPEVERDDRSVVIPSPKQPALVAAKILDELYRDAADVLTLRWWRGGFYRWDAGRWAEVEDRTIRAALYKLLRDATYWDESKQTPELRAWSPNRYKVTDVLDALAAVGHTSQDTTPPLWFERRDGEPPAGELIAVANGLLHVPTRLLYPHTPRLLNTVAVPFPYEPDAPAPARWLAFLNDLWPDDPDARAALQEWFGYVISGATMMHKILLLVGPFRSGKGTIGRVLQALVGTKNTCGPTLASLSTNFGLQDLIGKTLAIVADARLGTHNANVVVERLLSVSGEDSLTIDRKYKDHWFGRLDTRFMILSNELPGFGDASGAIATRFLVLTLTRSWLGREDHELTSALLAELPGILNWGLDGLDRLRAQDRFTEPASASDAITALHDTVSPTSAFVRDRCVVGPEHEVDVNVLYTAWRSWCEEQGRDRPGSAGTFGKNLRAVVPGVKRVRPRDGDGREYRYAGIRLRTISDPQWPGPRTKRDQTDPEPAERGPVLAGPRTDPMFSPPEDGPVVELEL